MILVDTSAWIEFLRDTGSPIAQGVETLIRDDAPLATCDTVVMEVLSDAIDEPAANDLMRLLDRCRFYPTRPLFDSTGSAAIYRACRRAGFTPRRLNDYAIASVALEHQLSMLHTDRDFEHIATVTGLLLEQ